jgi:CheY-like chemotaxis protein
MAHILVIDDDDQVRYFIRRTIEKEGHSVSEAADGAEGVRAFQDSATDLVFCDLIMPNKEGLETIRELRALDSNVRIVAISGGFYQTGVDYLPLAKALGAITVLRKPFHRADIVELLQQHLPPSEEKSE